MLIYIFIDLLVIKAFFAQRTIHVICLDPLFKTFLVQNMPASQGLCVQPRVVKVFQANRTVILKFIFLTSMGILCRFDITSTANLAVIIILNSPDSTQLTLFTMIKVLIFFIVKVVTDRTNIFGKAYIAFLTCLLGLLDLTAFKTLYFFDAISVYLVVLL